jgi:SAM-dependent methyltransferase
MIDFFKAPKPEWSSDEAFKLAGIDFRLDISSGKFQARNKANRLVLLKTRAFVDMYLGLLERLRPKRVLEFGLWEGGSAVLLTIAGKLERLVGIDLRKEPAHLRDIVDRHELGQRMKLHYGVSQSDQDAVRRILREEIGDEPLDLIIDDASHFYRHSKASLEASFGFLRPGGIYALEDWGWSHWPGWVESESWRSEPGLSNLVLEATLSVASGSDIIAGVEVPNGNLALFKRGAGLPHGAHFDLAASIAPRRPHTLL